jgi:hypothetical protein
MVKVVSVSTQEQVPVTVFPPELVPPDEEEELVPPVLEVNPPPQEEHIWEMLIPPVVPT